MFQVAKIVLFYSFCLILINGCTDNAGNDSPFADILDRPPYASLSDSIRKEPGRDELYFRRAILLNTNELPEPALADFKKAWELKKNEQYALGAGSILLETKPGEAVQFLQSAVKLLPESVLLNITLARALDAGKKPDEALAICNRLLSANPEQVDFLKMKADLLGKLGKEQDAMTILEKAYTLTPYDVELNYILALKYAETKNPKVLQLCDSLIKADSDSSHAEPYYYKGIYYATIHDKVAAIRNFDEAVKHDYYFLDAYIEKGILYYESRQYKEALAVFNLSLTISPKYADNYYWIAKCQQAQGLREEAKLNYQRAFGLDKEFKAAKDSAEKL